MIDYILEHWDSIFGWFGLAVATASGAIKLTPSKKDDGLWGKIIGVLDYISIFNTPSNKEKLQKLAGKK
jgi:hypothetical protein